VAFVGFNEVGGDTKSPSPVLLPDPVLFGGLPVSLLVFPSALLEEFSSFTRRLPFFASESSAETGSVQPLRPHCLGCMCIIRKLCLYPKNPSMRQFANTQPPEEYTVQHINPWLDALYNGDKASTQ
jgi:hypothetical protein